MTIPFVKMHGLGNDYVYLDCFSPVTSELIARTDVPALARRASDRHFGIGSDGLVLMEPSEKADVKMRMFNANGSEAEMCGNAVRCIAKYAFEKRLCGNPMTIETLAGIKQLSMQTTREDKVMLVTVNMGKPFAQTDHLSLDGNVARFVQVDMGNPHAVIFTDTSLDELPIETLGPLWEHHPHFPEGTNIEWVQVLNANELNMRVWERGSGETMACGTGACAAVVAAILCHKVINEVTVHLNGGDLYICVDDKSGDICMTGSATEVFRGEYTI